MEQAVVNPLKEDGTPKTLEEIAQERKDKGLPENEPGSQTNPALLLKSLQEEREKRRQDGETIVNLTARITELETALDSSDVFSEEGKALKGEIDGLKSKVTDLTKDLTKKDILIEYPVLKERNEEFEKFLADPENKGMSLKTSARAFLTELGLLEPVRKGLERTTGGERKAPSTEMSLEEIKHLRETNFKLYQQKLERGEIKV